MHVEHVEIQIWKETSCKYIEISYSCVYHVYLIHRHTWKNVGCKTCTVCGEQKRMCLTKTMPRMA